jgi:CII-binding regulator of phage lambda lysogenization HflD
VTNRNNDALENLVSKGYALEKQLNELIQTRLNRKEIAEYGDLGSEFLARRMRNVKENVELLSFQFNFPTKNDMANLARLMVQLEEKMDNIEEQLAKLSVSMEHVQRSVQMLSYQTGSKDNVSPRFQTKEGNVMLSKAPGKDSKVIQMERWLSL